MQTLICPLSVWHSTSSLTSISEERDIIFNTPVGKYFKGSAVNVSDCIFYPPNSSNTVVNRNSIQISMNSSNSSNSQKQFHYCQNYQHDKNEKDIQHQSNFLNHSEEKKFKLSTETSEVLAHINKNTAEQHDEHALKASIRKQINNSMYPNQGSQSSYSVSQDYIYCNNHRKFSTPTDTIQRQRAASMQSDQNILRNRSQSVHHNCMYFSNLNEEENDRNISNQNSVKTDMTHQNLLKADMINSYKNIPYRNNVSNLNRATKLQDANSEHKSNFWDKNKSSDINIKQQNGWHPGKSSYSSLSFTEALQLSLKPAMTVQSRASNKSISWDNLLAVIGLHNESNSSVHEIMEEDSNDDVFVSVTPVQKENTKNVVETEKENLQVSHRRKMRSQSFTVGYPLRHKDLKTYSAQDKHMKLSSDGVKIKKTDDNSSTTMKQSQNIEHQKQSVKEPHCSSLLRRASIQCEAVLTQTSSNRKIINPLQDVDISSLHFPGPLHAVTLQYSSIPMNKKYKPDNPSSSFPGIKEKTKSNLFSNVDDSLCIASKQESSTSSNTASEQESSAASKQESSNLLNRLPENHSSTFQDVQIIPATSQSGSTESFHKNIPQLNSQKEHPIPKPRTSIKKPGHEAIPNTNTSLKKSNQTTQKREETFQCVKSEKILLQSTVGSNLIISNSNLAMNKKQKQNISSELQNSEVKSEIKECKSELSNSMTEKADHVNVGFRTLSEHSRKSITTQNVVPLKEDFPNVDKAVPDINSCINITDNFLEKLTHKNDESQALKEPYKNLTESKSQIQSRTSLPETNARKPSSFLSQKYFFHNPDVSVLSDEGYGTCDSVSQQSQLVSYGQSQSCDITALKIDRYTKKNSRRELECSHNNFANGFKQHDTPSNIKHFRYPGISKDLCGSDKLNTAQTRSLSSIETAFSAGNRCHFYDGKQDKSTLLKPAKIINSEGGTAELKLPNKQLTSVVIDLSNQKTTAMEDDNRAKYLDRKNNSGKQRHESEKHTSHVKKSNNSAKNASSAVPLKQNSSATQSFRQTAV